MASRGICGYCRRDVALKKNGTLMKHGAGEADRKRRGDTTYRGCVGRHSHGAFVVHLQHAALPIMLMRA